MAALMGAGSSFLMKCTGPGTALLLSSKGICCIQFLKMLQARFTPSRTFPLLRPMSTLLQHSINRFNNVNLSVPQNIDITDYEPNFKYSFEHFHKEGCSAIWLHIPRSSLHFLNTVLSPPYSFNLHHAVPDDNSVMLTKWFHQGPAKLPAYSNHSAGAGGLVFNSQGKLLLIQQRYKFGVMRNWKLPGGSVDHNQGIEQGAVREVFEETGIQSTSLGIFSFREHLNFRFGRSDLYFIVMCRADTSEIKIDPQEIAKAKWFSLDQVLSDEFQKYHTFAFVAAKMAKLYKGDSLKLIDQMEKRLLKGRETEIIKYFELE